MQLFAGHTLLVSSPDGVVRGDGYEGLYHHNTRVIVLAQDPAQARYVAEAIAREAFHNVSYFPGTLDEARAAVPQ